MNNLVELSTDERQLVDEYRALSEPDKKIALVSFSQAKTSSTLFSESFKNATNFNIIIHSVAPFVSHGHENRRGARLDVE